MLRTTIVMVVCALGYGLAKFLYTQIALVLPMVTWAEPGSHVFLHVAANNVLFVVQFAVAALVPAAIVGMLYRYIRPSVSAKSLSGVAASAGVIFEVYYLATYWSAISWMMVSLLIVLAGEVATYALLTYFATKVALRLQPIKTLETDAV